MKDKTQVEGQAEPHSQLDLEELGRFTLSTVNYAEKFKKTIGWVGAEMERKFAQLQGARVSPTAAIDLQQQWEAHIEKFRSEYRNPLIRGLLNVLWELRPRLKQGGTQ